MSDSYDRPVALAELIQSDAKSHAVTYRVELAPALPRLNVHFREDGSPSDVFSTLSGDLDKCFRRLDALFDDPGENGEYDYDESDGRNYVRAAFACIEGMSFSMRVWATSRLLEEGRMSDQERWSEGESNLEVIEDEVRRSMAELSFEENVSLTFTLLDRINPSGPPFDVSQQWWSSLRKAVELRDRVTHPRAGSDLDISRDELMIMVDAEAGYRLLLSSYLELTGP
jgi:hypothetical protein